MARNFVWFDDWIKTVRGERKPFYDFAQIELPIEDESLHWFHERYGRMQLFRLWKVDDSNFIAEDLKISCYTSDPRWKEFQSNPELALRHA